MLWQPESLNAFWTNASTETLVLAIWYYKVLPRKNPGGPYGSQHIFYKQPLLQTAVPVQTKAQYKL